MAGTAAPATAAKIETVRELTDGAHCSHRRSMASHEEARRTTKARDQAARTTMRREAPRVGLLMGAEQLPERQRVRVAKMGVPGGNSDWVKKFKTSTGFSVG